MKPMLNDKEAASSKKRRTMMIMPLIIYPFLTLLLWSTGVVGSEHTLPAQENKKGLQAVVPSPNKGADSNWNKLKYYEQAEIMNEKRLSDSKSDPYYMQDSLNNDVASIRPSAYSGIYDPPSVYNNYHRGKSTSSDLIAEQKLRALQQMLSTPSEPTTTAAASLDRLQSSVQTSVAPETKEEDPEIKQLTSLIDKIMDIQHPQRVKEKTENTHVTASQKRVPFIAYEAVIPEKQQLVSGSTVRLQLLQQLVIDSIVTIPSGEFLYGVVSLSGERLQVNVQTIRTGQSIIPVNLEVYDLDGMLGIRVPGTISREQIKEAGGDAIQNVELISLDPSVKAQAATASINAAKGLFSKKAKLVRLTIPAGYKILIKQKN
jgi:hypothetical protein